MAKHTLVLGIEHLMTGICLANMNDKTGNGFQFVRESASTVRVESDEPFMANWPNRSTVFSEPSPDSLKMDQSGEGEIEWYAQVLAPAMTAEWQRLYHAQRYTRAGGKLADGEPECFPLPVIQAMVRKHGKHAFQYLSALRWAGDHWMYIKDNMYLGVEPDGHIHT